MKRIKNDLNRLERLLGYFDGQVDPDDFVLICRSENGVREGITYGDLHNMIAEIRVLRADRLSLHQTLAELAESGEIDV